MKTHNWFMLYYKMTKGKKAILFNGFDWRKNKVLARFLKQAWK